MDFYGLLGLSRSASSSEIKAAFKKKAVEHHPDKCALIAGFRWHVACQMRGLAQHK